MTNVKPTRLIHGKKVKYFISDSDNRKTALFYPLYQFYSRFFFKFCDSSVLYNNNKNY